MNIGKAVAIFEQIESDKYTDIEKGEAIYRVMNMPTHNSITKKQILKTLKYMWNLCYELPKEVENE